VVRRFSLPWLSLGLVVAGTLVVPLGLRAVNAAVRSPKAAPSYIPAIESPRERAPFDVAVVNDLRGGRPDYITIGDSMAGTRIDTGDLGRLVYGRRVVGLFDAGRGSAFWYLAFKNWIVEAGVKPRTVIFFFRDENLTDPLFRVWPGSLDRAASEAEPRLNEILAARANGTFFRVHQAAQAVYQYDAVRAWLEPKLLRAPAALASESAAPDAFLDRMNEEVFKLEALRPMVLADMEAADDKAYDFRKFLPVSLLPEILRLSKVYDVPVAFVRVQRRPEGNKPPRQSKALKRYVSDLASYLAANGAGFHDDWGDPELTLEMYGDGDHIKSEYRSYYTAVLVRKAPGLFR
jgi:hypothetical protein